MRKRLVKKQITKCIGFLVNGCAYPVYNCVSNPSYNGGTCMEKEEDCYKFEIVYVRKRYGAPLYLRNRYLKIYNKFQEKLNKC